MIPINTVFISVHDFARNDFCLGVSSVKSELLVSSTRLLSPNSDVFWPAAATVSIFVHSSFSSGSAPSVFIRNFARVSETFDEAAGGSTDTTVSSRSPKTATPSLPLRSALAEVAEDTNILARATADEKALLGCCRGRTAAKGSVSAPCPDAPLLPELALGGPGLVETCWPSFLAHGGSIPDPVSRSNFILAFSSRQISPRPGEAGDPGVGPHP
mmetsp:Transcript_32117/g.72085  ORF Transcript_32117/g.72085 Transcript_32117/m.72085 type:complete len:214 (+) Transcript_32117:1215-1856(+)